jgi:hypothetical protein
MKMIGAFAGILTILFGVLLLGGIYYVTGEQTTGLNTIISYNTSNTSMETEYNNLSTAYSYQKITFPTIIDKDTPIEAGVFLGLCVILLGLFAMLHYGGRVYGDWNS